MSRTRPARIYRRPAISIQGMSVYLTQNQWLTSPPTPAIEGSDIYEPINYVYTNL